MHLVSAVVGAVYVGIFTALPVAATAIITPHVLYDAIALDKPLRVSLSYAQDVAPFGYVGLPKNDINFNRICGLEIIGCSGSNFSVIPTDNPDNFTTYT